MGKDPPLHCRYHVSNVVHAHLAFRRLDRLCSLRFTMIVLFPEWEGGVYFVGGRRGFVGVEGISHFSPGDLCFFAGQRS